MIFKILCLALVGFALVGARPLEDEGAQDKTGNFDLSKNPSVPPANGNKDGSEPSNPQGNPRNGNEDGSDTSNPQGNPGNGNKNGFDPLNLLGSVSGKLKNTLGPAVDGFKNTVSGLGEKIPGKEILNDLSKFIPNQK